MLQSLGFLRISLQSYRSAMILNISTKNKALAAVFSLVLVLCVTIYGQFHLIVNHSLDVFFSPDQPVYAQNKALHEVFPEDDVYLVLFKGDDVYSADFIMRLSHIARKIQALPGIERVVTVTTADHIRGTDDGFEVGKLLDPEEHASMTDGQRRDRALSDRFALRQIVSPDGESIGMIVRPDEYGSTTTQIKLRKTVMDIINAGGLQNHIAAISGSNEVIYQQNNAMIQTLSIFIPLSGLLSFVLMVWMYPRISAVVMAMLAIGVSMQIPVALLALLRWDYAMTHAIIQPMMSALCTALLIHLYSAMQKLSHIYSDEALVRQALKKVKKPAFYTALTTASGFGSLVFSPVPPIQSFGLVTAVGVISIYVIVCIILPPVLAVWQSDKPWPRGHIIDRWLDGIVRSVARIGIRKAGWVLGIVVIFIGLGSVYLEKIKIETDFTYFFGADHPFNKSTRLIEDSLSGTITLDVVFQTDEFDSLKKPENIAAVRAAQHWLQQQPEVDKTVSYPDFIEEMNWAFHGEDDSYRKIPEDSALISQYLFVYDGNDLYEIVDHDFQMTRIVVNLNVHEATKVADLIDRIDAHLQHIKTPAYTLNVLGFGRLFADLMMEIVTTQLVSLLITVVIIFIFLWGLFRHFGDAALCMIPNIAPAILCFILMGALDIPLDVATTMIASVGIGIAVDDTIHFYHSYKEERRHGHDTISSLMRAYRYTGRAVTATTLVLGLQFMVIMLSDFKPASNFGLLIAAGIFAAWIFDMLVLVAILVVSHVFKVRKET